MTNSTHACISWCHEFTAKRRVNPFHDSPEISEIKINLYFTCEKQLQLFLILPIHFQEKYKRTSSYITGVTITNLYHPSHVVSLLERVTQGVLIPYLTTLHRHECDHNFIDAIDDEVILYFLMRLPQNFFF
jgi:hypothetical protein